MRASFALLIAVCALAVGAVAQTAAADTTASVTSTFSASPVATCGGSTTVRVTINAQDPPETTRPIDVMWALDESGSITASDFASVKASVIGWANGQVFGATHVGAGVVQFSTNARLSIPLGFVQASFINGVNVLYQRGGNTGIGTGIQLAQQELVSAGRGSSAEKVLIVETDGFNNVATVQFPQVVAAAKAAGITLFAVGVGSSIDLNELHQIASDPSYVFTPSTYSQLPTVFNQIGTILSPAATGVTYDVQPSTGWQITAASASAGSSAPMWSGSSLRWNGGTLHTGTTTITYTLKHTGSAGGTVAPQQAATLAWTDSSGVQQSTSYASQTVQVDGCNQPPTANAGTDQTVDLSNGRTASVTLDGTGSSDDGQIQPLSYSWSENGTQIATGATPTVGLPLGHHVLTLTVDDGQYTATDDVIIDVVDPTPPDVVPTISGTLGSNGWYVSDVTVSWSATDAESDITSSTGCDTSTVSTDTAGTQLSCTATSAGGTTTVSTPTIERDTTPPSIVYSGNSGTYGVADTVAITCAATDALSGVADSTCTSVNAPAYTFASGANTLSATATDVAGNIGTGSTTFTVVVRANDVCSLVNSWVNQNGVANALCVKLAHGQTEAFVNQVNAQRGKLITAAHADALIRLANGL